MCEIVYDILFYVSLRVCEVCFAEGSHEWEGGFDRLTEFCLEEIIKTFNR